MNRFKTSSTSQPSIDAISNLLDKLNLAQSLGMQTEGLLTDQSNLSALDRQINNYILQRSRRKATSDADALTQWLNYRYPTDIDLSIQY